MMEDLFSNVDLDLNLDLMGVDPASTNNLGFLPEDLFNFIDEDLKEIENGAIPDIESLINFDEDDQFPDDEIQWDFDLDTTDFFKNTAQEYQQQQQAIKFESAQSKPDKQLSKSNQSSSTTAKTSKSCSKSNGKSNSKSSNKPKKNSKQLQPQSSLVDQNVVSPSSTGYSAPNSPQSTYSSLEGGNSSDSNDFLDMFPTYYSYDGNNNLVSHPISELSIDELNELSSNFSQQQLPTQYAYDAWPESTFDLSNNFGGFVNVQSALSLVNGASIARSQRPKLVAANKLRRTKSKGTSLLANKPKSYKTIKKEMQLKKHVSLVSSQSRSSSHSQLTTTNGGRLNDTLVLSASSASCLSGSSNQSSQTITIEPTATGQPGYRPSSSSPYVHSSTTQITVITTFAQDHDYCSSIASPF